MLFLLIINLPLAVFYRQSLSYDVIDKSQEQNSALDLFPLQSRLHSCTCPSSPLLSDQLANFACAWPWIGSFNNFLSSWLLQLWQPNSKNIPCSGQEQEQLVNTARPLLPKLRLHKFSLRASSQQQSRNALQTSILWIFHDPPVNSLNQTGNEMMCCSGIRFTDQLRVWCFWAKIGHWCSVLPNSLARIIARRLDSKASNSGSSLSIVCAAFWISKTLMCAAFWILKSSLNLWSVSTWQLYYSVYWLYS